jgi:hypothetical protein
MVNLEAIKSKLKLSKNMHFDFTEMGIKQEEIMIGTGDTFTKSGMTFKTLSQTVGRIVTKCKCEECQESGMPYFKLPCGCYHALVVSCTCKLKDSKCRRCTKCWIPVGGTFHEVVDPHVPINEPYEVKEKASAR